MYSNKNILMHQSTEAEQSWASEKYGLFGVFVFRHLKFTSSGILILAAVFLTLFWHARHRIISPDPRRIFFIAVNRTGPPLQWINRYSNSESKNTSSALGLEASQDTTFTQTPLARRCPQKTNAKTFRSSVMCYRITGEQYAVHVLTFLASYAANSFHLVMI